MVVRATATVHGFRLNEGADMSEGSGQIRVAPAIDTNVAGGGVVQVSRSTANLLPYRLVSPSNSIILPR